MPNDKPSYKQARTARQDVNPKPAMPDPKEKTKPDYLLNNENRFDKNVYTPEDMIKRGVLTHHDPYGEEVS
jgi:hypothetical protein